MHTVKSAELAASCSDSRDGQSVPVSVDRAEIVVVRHGQTEWNVEKIIRGGGESKDQLYQRCTTCLRNIGLKHRGERVVVVTHGSVLACLYWQARPNEGRSGAKIQNASVSVFHLFGGDDWVIKSWVDISHLNQTGEALLAFEIYGET